MQLSTAVRPISWIKENAAQMLKDLEETGKPFVITQKGMAKAVVMDIQRYDELQESLAMLKLLGLTSEEVKTGVTRPADDVFAELQHEINQKKLQESGSDE